MRQAVTELVDDALFVDADGIVLEGPTTNIWWRRERTLFTPSLDLGILAGVTRAIVVGGGLTAIDTATELMAYYPVQVERLLARATVGPRGGEPRVGPGHARERQAEDAHAAAVHRDREVLARSAAIAGVALPLPHWLDLAPLEG